MKALSRLAYQNSRKQAQNSALLAISYLTEAGSEHIPYVRKASFIVRRVSSCFGGDVLPPHCDTMDGPVVKAAKQALESGNVNLVLAYVPRRAERELKEAFEKTMQTRKVSVEARDLADYWFFETAVRLHREGEGAPYTGLKPAGLDWGPVVPRAEKAIEQGDPKEVVDFLKHAVEEELRERFKHITATKGYDVNDVAAAREHVEAMLGFELYSHHVYTNITHWEHGEQAEKGGHEH